MYIYIYTYIHTYIQGADGNPFYLFYKKPLRTKALETALVRRYRMCSLTVECVILLQNMFSYYRIKSHYGLRR